MVQGNGHAFPFKVSEINIFPEEPFKWAHSMFYFLQCGACWLWNGNLKCDTSILTSSGVLFNSSSLNPINFLAQRKCRAPLWWFCLAPSWAFVNQVLNFKQMKLIGEPENNKHQCSFHFSKKIFQIVDFKLCIYIKKQSFRRD